MEKEIFKEIKGFEGLYKVGTNGTVLSMNRKVKNNKIVFG